MTKERMTSQTPSEFSIFENLAGDDIQDDAEISAEMDELLLGLARVVVDEIIVLRDAGYTLEDIDKLYEGESE